MPSFSITTRTGDSGTTRLYSGETVSKASARPDAYGAIDELVSQLGVARCYVRLDATRDAVLYVQRTLFRVASELATTAPHLDRLKQRVDAACLAELDARRDALEATITLPNGFIVPGGEPSPAHLDLARAMSRRCERLAVALFESGEITNSVLLVWLNRLSDYLYLLARSEETAPMLVKEL